MKKLLLLALSSSLLFTACENKANFAPTLGDGYSFKSEIKGSKSRVTDNSFDSGDAIGVWAYSDAALSTETAANVKYVYANDFFSSVTPITPDAAAGNAFRAVYPYDAEQESTEFTFDIAGDQTTAENYAKSDLLVAETELSTAKQPTLKFSHKLSEIKVTLTSEDVAISSASVAFNVLTQAECDLAADSFEGAGSKAEIQALKEGEDFFRAIIAPQSFSAGDEIGTITANGKAMPIIMQNDFECKSGFSYSYTGEVTSDGVLIFTSTDIENWGDGGDITAEGETEGGDEPAADGDITIKLNKATDKDIWIDVDKGDYTGNYYLMVESELGWEYSDFETYEDFAADRVEREAYSFFSDVDFDVADGKVVFDENATIPISGTGWTINPDTKYLIAVCGANNDGEVISNVATLWARTSAPGKDGSISIEISSVGSETITIKTKPQGVDSYVVGALPTADYETLYGSDKDKGAAAVVEFLGFSRNVNYNGGFGEVDNTYIFDKAATIELSDIFWIDEDIDYTLFAFSTDVTGKFVTSEITTVETKTEEGIGKEEILAMENSLLVTVASAEPYNMFVNVSTLSNYPGGNYYVFSMDREFFDAPVGYNQDLGYSGYDYDGDGEGDVYETCKKFLQITVDDWGIDLVGAYPQYCTFSASTEDPIDMSDNWFFDPGHEYVVVAFGYDAKGDITTGITVIEQTTPLE